MGATTTTNMPGPHSVPRWILTAVIGRHPRWTLIRLAVLVLGTWVVFNYVLTPPMQVYGISMEPTFHDGQKIYLISRVAKKPQRGDVVRIRWRQTDGVRNVKRVLGLPGETIAFVKGRLYINNQPQDEPYVKTDCDWNMPPKLLGPDEYYVSGDNRGMAFDEHWHRAVSLQQIEGKVLFRGNS